MIVVNRFASSESDFLDRLEIALLALAARPGYLRGSVGRSTDDTVDWVLVTEWRNVGAYRRALGNYDVKLRATPVLGLALDQPSAFEQLVSVDSDRAISRTVSDRAEESAGRREW